MTISQTLSGIYVYVAKENETGMKRKTGVETAGLTLYDAFSTNVRSPGAPDMA